MINLSTPNSSVIIASPIGNASITICKFLYDGTISK